MAPLIRRQIWHCQTNSGVNFKPTGSASCTSSPTSTLRSLNSSCSSSRSRSCSRTGRSTACSRATWSHSTPERIGRSLLRGASVYDVRTKGGTGVPSKADIVSNLSKEGCGNLRTRGEGVKNSENFADVLNESPLMCVPGISLLFTFWR